ncbi:hypothetical protein NDU88_004478 [Pleurodeles waltl]|uniref:Uncharacterized protein n=1 Tax=Pleurodeles waltl TaxID=8319 RepID=A0AAV7V5C4_PLEWA|nr:hypothetical protein NDU88_004478 [Pleurodeles waltl]
MKSVHFHSRKISIYPDYTNKVQGFLEVKAKLRLLKYAISAVFCLLKVLHSGKSYFFDIPEDVWKWLAIWDKVPRGEARPRRKNDGTAWGSRTSNWRSREEASQLELLPGEGELYQGRYSGRWH